MLPLRDSVPSRTVPFVNYAIIAANLAVFLFELRLGPRELQGFFYAFGLVPALVTDAGLDAGPAGRWLPFLSSMFLHGGWMHFLGNMWTLHIFGDNVEDRVGHGRYLIYYLLGGLAAGALQVAVSAGSTVPMVGASGAIAAVMGGYALLHPHGRVLTLVPLGLYTRLVELPAMVFMGIWMLMQLYSGTVAVLAGVAGFGGVAWWAHVGGFVGGMLLLPVFRRPERPW